MSTRHELRFVDKSGWPDGPWMKEPDKVQWTDEATGLPCLIRRNHQLGNWCGYVGVAASHPAFGKDCREIDVDVHGGLTFAEFCDEDEKETGICHVPEPGSDARVWWFGFDCGHAWDLEPGMMRLLPRHMFLNARSTYRDIAYVQGECRHLARQLAEIVVERPETSGLDDHNPLGRKSKSSLKKVEDE
jgi:hypothetical protein